MFNCHQEQLSNGLIILRIPMPAVKSLTAMTLVNVGSRFERPVEYGLAHVVEHMVFKGTKQYPDRLKMAIELDGIGANSNAFTSKEYTGFYVTVASHHYETSLKILKELIFAPLLRQQDLEQEKQVIIEEIRMRYDSPEDYIAEEFERLIYQGSGLEHPISGSVESVINLKTEFVRSFLDSWYGLGNIVLVLAGDAKLLNQPEFLKTTKKIFSAQPTAKQNEWAKKRQTLLKAPPISNQRLLVSHRETAQAHLTLGWPALKRDDPQRYVLSVLSVVLGGNRSSRLFNTVRENKNLAYYVHADVDQYHDVGLFGACAGVNLDRVQEGIEATVKEFYKLATGLEPVKSAELKKAKDYLTGKMILGLEDSQSVAYYYGLHKMLLNRVEDPEEVNQKIQQVTIAEVQELAKKLIQPKQLRLGVIGPENKLEKINQVWLDQVDQV